MTDNREESYLSAPEIDLLASIGYLVMRWNYAEHCSRQILRRHTAGDDINHSEQLRVSSLIAIRLEEQLRDVALPNWRDPGRPYLERLIEAFSVAREHRNHYVHGVWMTANPGDSGVAQGVLVPAKPKQGKSQMPSCFGKEDLVPLQDYFAALGEFAQAVGVAFQPDGERARNPDGSFVMDALPPIIEVLGPVAYRLID